MLQTIVITLCLGDIMWLLLAFLACTQPEKNPDSEWNECTADFCPDGEYVEEDASGNTADDTENANNTDDSEEPGNTDDTGNVNDTGSVDDTGDSDENDDSNGSGGSENGDSNDNTGGSGSNGDGSGNGTDDGSSDTPEDEDTGNPKESVECGCRNGSSSLAVIFFLFLNGLRRRQS